MSEEHWSVRAAEASVATLDIPPDAVRDRSFEIACAMTVSLREPLDGAWHQLTIVVNGAQQWRRRIDTSNPGAFDGLDYRFRRVVPVGEALRVVALVECRGSLRRSLEIEATED